MNSRTTTILLWVIGAAIAAGATWLWFDKMEQRWVGIPYVSPAAEKNHMLAAERWLTQHQQTVHSYTHLAQAPLANLPSGMMLIPENDGILTAEHSTVLLDWVQRGNTLVMRPPTTKEYEGGTCGVRAQLPASPATKAGQNNPAQDIVWNPITDKLGVKIARRLANGEPDDETTGQPLSSKEKPSPQKNLPTDSKDTKSDAYTVHPCLTRWSAPQGSRYPLWMDVSKATLVSAPNTKQPQREDDTGAGVRIYPEGKGHIVLIADNYFSNKTLGAQDHAELLLALARIHPQASNTIIIGHLDMPKWYELIWDAARFGIISAACALLALLWIGLRRFGPVLPEPQAERRSLMEHIDASGRWLWNAAQGPEQLLQATRAPVIALLSRKVPLYQRLTQDERVHAIMSDTSAIPLTYTAIHSALFAPASTQPAAFTRQIQTLTQLKKHYDR